MKPRIAIVGGGNGGLTCGIALRRRGFEVDVYVYEQAPEASAPHPCEACVAVEPALGVGVEAE